MGMAANICVTVSDPLHGLRGFTTIPKDDNFISGLKSLHRYVAVRGANKHTAHIALGFRHMSPHLDIRPKYVSGRRKEQPLLLF